ncbi:hypothetical protein [Tunicatimonas pelagia]|uniref:hypothetical protein n=1 Tax=Tunicatimonas pelagia TaxID=931531 RepID=UPI0026667FEC|nr:hypothetical protein [Tunicatimonas pelagia]WKN44278.1 hypothetical protein P0M28_04780 [Tunicatimonas pelagia]
MDISERTLLQQYVMHVTKQCRVRDVSLPRSLKRVQRYLTDFHGSVGVPSDNLSNPIDRYPFLAALKKSVVVYWRMEADVHIEPPDFLIDVIDYIERISPYWFSYQQGQWLE